MIKENYLQKLLDELNQKYMLSEEFKKKVADLLKRIQALNLPPEQLEILAERIREAYERQSLLDSCRRESIKALENVRESINAYSNALNQINQELSRAETAIQNLSNSRPSSSVSNKPERSTKAREDNAKAMAAFLSIDSKNSRIN